uniref:Uncharacterized protein n=1 Tax=Cannabis sativa TaxID=3483 RepID=A0A803Q8L0_CANSA
MDSVTSKETMVEENINVTGLLSVEDEDDWECNDSLTEDLEAMSIVGRIIIYKRKCKRNFIQIVFDTIWEVTKGWDVRVLAFEECNTYVGFTFYDEFLQQRRRTKQEKVEERDSATRDCGGASFTEETNFRRNSERVAEPMEPKEQEHGNLKASDGEVELDADEQFP